jgi:hypothetical protein
MGRFPAVCDCDHIGCCKPCPSCAALRARIEDVEGMAKFLQTVALRTSSEEEIARAVSAWLKEGK